MAKRFIITVIEEEPAKAGCGTLFLLLLGWFFVGSLVLNIGVLIPGYDIEDYSPEEHWMPPWLDLWPDARHGIFISGAERSCYADGYDFCDCPSDLRAKILEDDDKAETPKIKRNSYKRHCGKYSLSHNGEVVSKEISYKMLQEHLQKYSEHNYLVYSESLGGWKPWRDVVELE